MSALRRLPLLAAFGVEPGAVVSLAGGGGKTRLMYALARALASEGRRVLTTTTTRIYPPAADESPSLLLLQGSADPLGAIRQRLALTRHLTVAERLNPDGKLAGLPAALVDDLAAAALTDAIIVEADGSAGRSLKAARDGEPVFPRSSTHCVLVMGMDALGMPLDEPWVFRSALASEITGVAQGTPVTAEAIAELLLGPRGLAARAPDASRLAVFLNKVESPEQETHAYELARLLLARAPARLARAVVGSLERGQAGFTLFEKP